MVSMATERNADAHYEFLEPVPFLFFSARLTRANDRINKRGAFRSTVPGIYRIDGIWRATPASSPPARGGRGTRCRTRCITIQRERAPEERQASDIFHLVEITYRLYNARSARDAHAPLIWSCGLARGFYSRARVRVQPPRLRLTYSPIGNRVKPSLANEPYPRN